MAQVTITVHDPAVNVILHDGLPPEGGDTGELDAYVAATRADAQKMKDRPPSNNKPAQYVAATRTDAQTLIDRQP